MTNKICKISLFSCILAAISAVPGYCAIKMKGNESRSYAGAYNQVNAMRQQAMYVPTATTASATSNLPVAVDDESLANSILSNNSEAEVSIADLDACAMIYPNGIFKWGVPTSGIRRNKTNQCMAVVELREANSNAILATTTLGAGDSMKCNIDYFPESGYNMSALSQIELPADVAPTIEDVKKVMNQEQKQNAGLKIAAAAIISGVAGNILAPKTAGEKSGKTDFGAGETQLKTTALSAVAGAGVMAASTYSGKVVGDTIKSTAVNAASGMVVGNMLAGTGGGETFLTVVKCKVQEGGNTDTLSNEKNCVVGNIQQKGNAIESPTTEGSTEYYYIINRAGNDVKRCEQDGDNALKECSLYPKRLMNIKLQTENTGKTIDFEDLDAKTDKKLDVPIKYEQNTENNQKFTKTMSDTNNDLYFLIKSANEVDNSQHAYAVFGDDMPESKLRGKKKADWKDIKDKATYYTRYSDGTGGHEIANGNDVKYEFEPTSRDAESGGLIDLSNRSRVKGTATGAAVGGALGGVSAYQGAQQEISERWTTAIREYEDSLSNFVCMTGGRYLAKYNDYAEIPEPQKAE